MSMIRFISSVVAIAKLIWIFSIKNGFVDQTETLQTGLTPKRGLRPGQLRPNSGSKARQR